MAPKPERQETSGALNGFLENADNALNLVFGAALGAICGDKVLELTGKQLLFVTAAIWFLALLAAFQIMFARNFMLSFARNASRSWTFAAIVMVNIATMMLVPGLWGVIGWLMIKIPGIKADIFPFELTLCLLTAWSLASLTSAVVAACYFGD